MTIEDLMSICSSLPGTTTDIKWENHLCFNVGEKIYLITSPDEVPHTASFKVSKDDFAALTEKEGINQARYFAKGQWVSVDDIDILRGEEWKDYLAGSHALVASKLTKKKRTELGIE